MPNIFDKRKWKGKYLLEKMELISFFIFYTVILIVPLIIVQGQGKEFGGTVIFWIIIGIIFYIICFLALQQYVYRKIADKYNGIPIMAGWIDQEEDLGEEYEFKIAKMTRFERLSESERKAIESFIVEEKKKLNMFDTEGEIQDLIQLDFKKTDNKKLDFKIND